MPVNIKFITEGEEEIGSIHLDEFRTKYPESLLPMVLYGREEVRILIVVLFMLL